jgi:muramidase (phage lysozyme)
MSTTASITASSKGLDQRLVKATLAAEKDKAAAIKLMNRTVLELNKEVAKLKSKINTVTLTAREAYQELEVVVASMAEAEKLLIRTKKADPTDAMVASIVSYLRVLQNKRAILLNLVSTRINEENQLSADLKVFTDSKLRSPNYFGKTPQAIASLVDPHNLSKVPVIPSNKGVQGATIQKMPVIPGLAPPTVAVNSQTKVTIKAPPSASTPAFISNKKGTKSYLDNVIQFPNNATMAGLHKAIAQADNNKTNAGLHEAIAQIDNKTNVNLGGQKHTTENNSTSATMLLDQMKVMSETQEELLQLLEKAYHRDDLFQEWQKKSWADLETKLHDNDSSKQSKNNGSGSGSSGIGGFIKDFLGLEALEGVFGVGLNGFIATYLKRMRVASTKALGAVLKGAKSIAKDGLLGVIKVSGKSVTTYMTELTTDVINKWKTVQKSTAQRLIDFRKTWETISKMPGNAKRLMETWSKSVRNLFRGTVFEVQDFSKAVENTYKPIMAHINSYIKSAKNSAVLIKDVFKSTFPQSAKIVEDFGKTLGNVTRDMSQDIAQRLEHVSQDFEVFTKLIDKHSEAAVKSISNMTEVASKHLTQLNDLLHAVSSGMGKAVAAAAKVVGVGVEETAKVAKGNAATKIAEGSAAATKVSEGSVEGIAKIAEGNASAAKVSEGGVAGTSKVAEEIARPTGVFGYGAKLLSKAARAAKPIAKLVSPIAKFVSKAVPVLNAVDGGLFTESNLGLMPGSASLMDRGKGAVVSVATADIDFAKNVDRWVSGSVAAHDGTTYRHMLGNDFKSSHPIQYAQAEKNAQALMTGKSVTIAMDPKADDKTVRTTLEGITGLALNMGDDASQRIEKNLFGTSSLIPANRLPENLKFLSQKENAKFMDQPGIRKRVGTLEQNLSNNVVSAVTKYYEDYKSGKYPTTITPVIPSDADKLASDFVKWKTKVDPHYKPPVSVINSSVGSTGLVPVTNKPGSAFANITLGDFNKTAINPTAAATSGTMILGSKGVSQPNVVSSDTISNFSTTNNSSVPGSAFTGNGPSSASSAFTTSGNPASISSGTPASVVTSLNQDSGLGANAAAGAAVSSSPNIATVASPDAYTNALVGGVQSAGGSVSGVPSKSGSAKSAIIPGAADSSISPQGKALLDTIAGPESGGKYNVAYGGKTFAVGDGLQFPNASAVITRGVNSGKTSSASGRYQFEQGTWNEEKKKLKLKDFSPANQDRAAWDLAQTRYRIWAKNNNMPNTDLQTALNSKDPKVRAEIAHSLSGTWTSLPGTKTGEQGTSMADNSATPGMSNPSAGPTGSASAIDPDAKSNTPGPPSLTASASDTSSPNERMAYNPPVSSPVTQVNYQTPIKQVSTPSPTGSGASNANMTNIPLMTDDTGLLLLNLGDIVG